MTVDASVHYRKIGGVIAPRVAALQSSLLRKESGAVATLARLRRCSPGDVGAEPAVWAVTVGGLPAELRGRGDAPSPSERAAHAALVLYALHQQSRDVGVHRAGVRLGSAVGRLARARARDEALDDATVKRFHQVALAPDFTGRLYFLRGVIQLLRAERPPIGLDYGLLADDLRALATGDPQQRDSVLLRWGRDLHSLPESDSKERS